MVESRMSLPRVSKPKSIDDLGPVDISGLLKLVERVSERAWAAEDAKKENAFPCFHHTRHIVFRFIPGNNDARDYYSNPGWAVWQTTLAPILDAATAGYGFEAPAFPKVMLARLAAGHRIDPHYDGAGSNLQTHKIHVPLITNPEARFLAGGRSMHLAAGNAYEVNNIGEHAASNDGTQDRIHLIFEVFDAAPSLPKHRAPSVA